jgi:hypothetical protein
MRKRDETKSKSNYLRRRRVARTLKNGNGERRPAPPRPRQV